MGRLKSRIARLEEHSSQSAGERSILKIPLWEEVLRREAPTLAGDVRCDRDLLCRELDRLRNEWREQGRAHSTSHSDPTFWMVEGAAVNRNHAVKRGARLITDLDEAARIIERITDPATTPDEMIELIAWRLGRR